MKKNIFLLLLAVLTHQIFAQTELNKTIPVNRNQKIKMHFDYPKLITIATWDKNEILITGTVSINGGENDDSFVLEVTPGNSEVLIESYIKNMKSLPQRVTIMQNGKKIMFPNKDEFKKYQAENGKEFNNMSWGVDIEIKLEVKVPEGLETKLEAVYGMVEVKKFRASLDVEATYGGIDASVEEKTTGALTAETNYGNIYTNLNTQFNSENSKNEDFHTLVSAKPGNGPKYSFESKYGNVYLRKVN